MDLWDQPRHIPDCDTAFGNGALALKGWPISAYPAAWHEPPHCVVGLSQDHKAEHLGNIISIVLTKLCVSKK